MIQICEDYCTFVHIDPILMNMLFTKLSRNYHKSSVSTTLLDTAKIQIYRPILNWEANVRHTQIGWVQFTSCNLDFIHNSKWQIQESPGTAAKRDFSFFSPKNGQKGLAFGLSASYRMPLFWVGRLNKPSKTTIEFGKSCQWQWMWNII